MPKIINYICAHQAKHNHLLLARGWCWFCTFGESIRRRPRLHRCASPVSSNKTYCERANNSAEAAVLFMLTIVGIMYCILTNGVLHFLVQITPKVPTSGWKDSHWCCSHALCITVYIMLYNIILHYPCTSPGEQNNYYIKTHSTTSNLIDWLYLDLQLTSSVE